jgi:DNA-damage-inducible protein J
MMMLSVQPKSRTNIYLDVNIKDQAKEIFSQYGLSLSQAVNIFLTQSVLNRGLPFNVKIPNDETLQAMRDVESGENYEDVTLEDLKK